MYKAEFFGLFDTVTQLTGAAQDEQNFAAQAERAREILAQHHALYDAYQPHDDVLGLYDVNQSAGIAPVEVDVQVLDMLAFAVRMHEQTAGGTDIALGAVTGLWREARLAALDAPDKAALPDEAALRAAALHVDIGDLVLDEGASTAYLRDPLMRLDVGAIAKGYAVEQTARQLEQEGVASLLISVGGNIRAIGERPGGGPWRVELIGPDQASIAMVEVAAGQSLVSSGGHQRYFTVDGQTYHHVIDPSTLYPARHCAMVAVLCADSGYADALSTFLFNLPVEQAQAEAQALPGVEALWLLHDGHILKTPGFPG